MNVKILGSGCRNCVATAELVAARAEALGVPVTIEKVTDYAAIAGHGVIGSSPLKGHGYTVGLRLA